MESLIGGLVVAAMSLLPLAAKASTIVDIGDLGGWWNHPTAINFSGQITGSSIDGSGNEHAYFYNGGTMTDLGTLGGTTSVGNAINDSGVVVGMSFVTGNVHVHPFVSSSGGTMTDLFPVAWANKNGNANAINDSGIIVGWLAEPWPLRYPYSYSGGTFTDLTASGLNANAYPVGISRDGEISAANGVTGSLSAICSSGSTTALPTLGMAPAEAKAINVLGQVVGTSYVTGGGATHAFLWTPDKPAATSGSIIDLGTLGGTDSQANAINDWGVVVGSSDTPSSGKHAFIYTECGGMVDLNTLLPSGSGWTLERAMGINAKGQIVGVGNSSTGASRGFLFTP